MPQAWNDLYIAAGRKSLASLRSQRQLFPDSPLVRLELVARLARENDSSYQVELLEEMSWVLENVEQYIWGRLGGVLSVTQPWACRRIFLLLREKALLPTSSETTLLNTFVFCERSEPAFAREVVEIALCRFPDGTYTAYWWDKMSDLIDLSSSNSFLEKFGQMLAANDKAISHQKHPAEKAEYILKRIGRCLEIDIAAAQVSLEHLWALVHEMPSETRFRYQAEIMSGRIHLRLGDVSAAAERLIRSLDHAPHVGAQGYVGPDLHLARELYGAASSAVREYIDRCANDFVRHKATLQEIAKQIERGEPKPTFVLRNRPTVRPTSLLTDDQ